MHDLNNVIGVTVVLRKDERLRHFGSAGEGNVCEEKLD